MSVVPEAANWCGERSDYPGYDIMTENVTISENFTQCQFQCELSENCQYVTFDTETLECMFKNGKNSSEPSETLISGPKICGNFQKYYLLSVQSSHRKVLEFFSIIYC